MKKTYTVMLYNKEGMALGLTTISTTRDTLHNGDKLEIFEEVLK